jgi:hypothetical protein
MLKVRLDDEINLGRVTIDGSISSLDQIAQRKECRRKVGNIHPVLRKSRPIVP